MAGTLHYLLHRRQGQTQLTGRPFVESWGSECTSLLSKLLFMEESRCGWIQS